MYLPIALTCYLPIAPTCYLPIAPTCYLPIHSTDGKVVKKESVELSVASVNGLDDVLPQRPVCFIPVTVLPTVCATRRYGLFLSHLN